MLHLCAQTRVLLCPRVRLGDAAAITHAFCSTSHPCYSRSPCASTCRHASKLPNEQRVSQGHSSQGARSRRARPSSNAFYCRGKSLDDDVVLAHHQQRQVIRAAVANGLVTLSDAPKLRVLALFLTKDVPEGPFESRSQHTPVGGTPLLHHDQQHVRSNGLERGALNLGILEKAIGAELHHTREMAQILCPREIAKQSTINVALDQPLHQLSRSHFAVARMQN